MERQQMRVARAHVFHRPRPRLVAADGEQLARLRIAPIDSPELPMTVHFEGITPAQQQAALAGFPGGRRFVLAN